MGQAKIVSSTDVVDFNEILERHLRDGWQLAHPQAAGVVPIAPSTLVVRAARAARARAAGWTLWQDNVVLEPGDAFCPEHKPANIVENELVAKVTALLEVKGLSRDADMRYRVFDVIDAVRKHDRALDKK